MEQRERIVEQALNNIESALLLQKMFLSNPKSFEININVTSQVVTTAVHALAFFDADTTCPTCPYLDSLEEDEPDCECEEPFQWPGAQLADARTLRVADFAAPDYSEDLGTYLIVCRN